jgi:Escherichia/Staphylococcus phage prohead protease
MSIRHKTAPVTVTTSNGDGTARKGWFEALVAAFGNRDKHGDRILPGAFDDTLARWRASGKQVPVIVSHTWSDPWAFIGTADPHEIESTSEGLVVRGRLDVEDNATARQTHRLMRRGNLTGWSFGYQVAPGGERRGKDGANEITRLHLHEIGPCLVGANDRAQLRAVKSAFDQQVKRGDFDPPSDTELRRRAREILGWGVDRGLALDLMPTKFSSDRLKIATFEIK